MTNFSTYHIHITGRVQGVGFRPFVFLLAEKFKISGNVSNGNDGVHIVLNADEEQLQQFIENIQVEKPALSLIENVEIEKTDRQHFTKFEIIESSTTEKATIPFTPDFAICHECAKEIQDPNNRRYRYPFATCTNCGPRYSIITGLPYDRINTTMQPFRMCETCAAEYNDVRNRRFYSQTNSCADCGMELSAFTTQKNCIVIGNENVLKRIHQKLDEGKIIAVKGIGGFLLLCDATNRAAIETLRQRKHRPHKPLAVLCSDKLRNTIVQEQEIEVAALHSAESPIVVMQRNDENAFFPYDLIAPGMDTVGIMWPYAPLLQIIASDVGRPLMATSANMSGAPVVYQNEQALTELFAIADLVVTHNRDITTPSDDSVVGFTKRGRRIIYRRARGLAPSNLVIKHSKLITCLSTGALLKSSFALAHSGNVYVSQYLGNTDSWEAQQSYVHTLQNMLQITGAKPEQIFSDTHPQYFSTQFAEQWSSENNIPLHKVQHHQAHFLSVLAENDLQGKNEPVLGVIWDGTGLGDDGQIWGGEFFVYQHSEIARAFYFAYCPVLAGDKMAKEPRLSTLSFCNNIPQATDLLKKYFTEQEWSFYRKATAESKISTSSMGRMFDAAVALLSLCSRQSFEGQAAMLLETEARRWLKSNNKNALLPYPFSLHQQTIDVQPMLESIIADVQARVDKGKIAAQFHYTLTIIIKTIAKQLNIRSIAFSGGVMQNVLLNEMIEDILGTDHALYFHKQLSPNDEGVAVGQLFS